MKWFIKILLDTWAFASPPGVSDQFWWWFLYQTLLEIRVSVTSNFPKIKAFNNPQHGEFYADNLDMPDKVWWGWEGTVSGGGHLICYMACVISAMPRILWKSSCRFQTFPTEDFISDICNWGKLFGTINFCCIPSVLMASLLVLQYLTTADFAIREELALKAAILAEKFAPNLAWYGCFQLHKVSGWG